MLFINDRVPGQLLPVGAKFNYNAGAPLALHEEPGVSGLGFTVLPAPKQRAKRSQFLPRPLVSIKGLGGSPDGLGADGLINGVSAFGVLLLAAGGYFAGKAMAPSQKNRNAYAIVGAINGAVFGPLGLGVQGIYAMGSK